MLTEFKKNVLPAYVSSLFANQEIRSFIQSHPEWILAGKNQSPTLTSLIYFLEAYFNSEHLHQNNSEFINKLSSLSHHLKLSEHEENEIFCLFWDNFIKEASHFAYHLKSQLNRQSKIVGMDEILDEILNHEQKKPIYYPQLNDLIETYLNQAPYAHLNDEAAFETFFSACEKQGIIFSKATMEKVCHDRGEKLFDSFRKKLDSLFKVQIDLILENGNIQCVIRGGFVAITNSLMQKIKDKLSSQGLSHQNIDNFIFSAGHHLAIDTPFMKEEFGGANVFIHAHEEIYICRNIEINLDGANGQDGQQGKDGANGSHGIKPLKPTTPGTDGCDGCTGGDGQAGYPGQNGENGRNGGSLYLKAKQLNLDLKTRQLQVSAIGGLGGKGGNGGNGGHAGNGSDGGDGSNGLNAKNGKSSQYLIRNEFDYDGIQYRQDIYQGYEPRQEATKGGKGGKPGQPGTIGMGGAFGLGGKHGQSGSISLDKNLRIKDKLIELEHRDLNDFFRLERAIDKQSNISNQGKNGEQGKSGKSGTQGQFGSKGIDGVGKTFSTPKPKEIPNLFWKKIINYEVCYDVSWDWGRDRQLSYQIPYIEQELKNINSHDGFSEQKYELALAKNTREKTHHFFHGKNTWEATTDVWKPCLNPRMVNKKNEKEQNNQTQSVAQAPVEVNNYNQTSIPESEQYHVFECYQKTKLEEQAVPHYFATQESIIESLSIKIESLELETNIWENLVSGFENQRLQDTVITEYVQKQNHCKSLELDSNQVNILSELLETSATMSSVYQTMHLLLKITFETEQNDILFSKMLAIVSEKGNAADLHQMFQLSRQHQISSPIKKHLSEKLHLKINKNQQNIAKIAEKKHFFVPDELIAPAYFEENQANSVMNELINYDWYQVVLKRNAVSESDENAFINTVDFLQYFDFRTDEQKEYFSDAMLRLNKFGLEKSAIQKKIIPVLQLLYQSKKYEAFFLVLAAIQKLENDALSKNRQEHICKNIQLFCINWTAFSYENEALDKFDQIPIGVWHMPLQLDYRKRLLQNLNLNIFDDDTAIQDLKFSDINQQLKEKFPELDQTFFDTDNEDLASDIPDITQDSEVFLNILYLFDDLLRQFENKGTKDISLKRVSNILLEFIKKVSALEEDKSKKIQMITEMFSFINREGIDKIFCHLDDLHTFNQLNVSDDSFNDWKNKIEIRLCPRFKKELNAEEIIEQLIFSKPDADGEKLRLTHDLLKIKDLLAKESTRLCELANIDFKTDVKKAFEEKDFPKIAVRMCQAANYAYGKTPYDVQLIAFLQFLYAIDSNESLAGEIATGEGKSLISNMVVACNALIKTNAKVMVVTSTPSLAIRDAEDSKCFFNCFGLNVANNCDAEAISQPVSLKERYQQNQIMFGQASDFERDRLMTDAKGADICQEWINNNKVSLFIDEIDKTIINDGSFTLFLSDDVPDFQLLDILIKDIWGDFFLKYQELLENAYSETAANHVKNQLLIHFQKKLSNNDYLLSKKLSGFASRNLSTWINSAHLACQLNINEDYIFQASKQHPGYTDVVVMNISSGVEQNSTQWTDMLHQFIQLKHQLNMTQPTAMSVYESHMSFVQKFNNRVYGVTGTLGSLNTQQLLNDLGNLSHFKLAKRCQARIKKYKETIKTDQEQWIKAIAQSVNEKKQNQPILIVVEHYGQVEDLCKALSEKGIKIKKTIDTNKAMEESIDVIKNVAAGDIFVTTYISGRGTNFELDKENYPEPGLHVILAANPESERDYLQIIGRCGRNGEMGSYEQILMDEDLTPLSMINYQRDFQDACTNDRIRTEDYGKNKLLAALYEIFLENQKNVFKHPSFKNLTPVVRDILWLEMKTRWALHVSDISQQYSSDAFWGNKDKHEILMQKSNEKLKKIVKSIQDAASQIEPKYFSLFSTQLSLGHAAYEQQHYEQAEKMFNAAAEQKNHAQCYAQYYQAIAQLKTGRNISYTTRAEAKKLFKAASKSLELYKTNTVRTQMKLDAMNNLISAHQKKVQVEEDTTPSNAALQTEHQNRALAVLSTNLQELIGNSFSFKDAHDYLLQSNKDQTIENTKSSLDQLVKNNTIKDIRLSKKIRIDDSADKQLFYNQKPINLDSLSERDKRDLLTFMNIKLQDEKRAFDKLMLKTYIRDTKETVFKELQEQNKISIEKNYQFISIDFSLKELEPFKDYVGCLKNLSKSEKPFNIEKFEKAFENTDKLNAHEFLKALIDNGLILVGSKINDIHLIQTIQQEEMKQNASYTLENMKLQLDNEESLEMTIDVFQSEFKNRYFVCSHEFQSTIQTFERISKKQLSQDCYYQISIDAIFDDQSLSEFQILLPLLQDLKNPFTHNDLEKKIQNLDHPHQINLQSFLNILQQNGFIKLCYEIIHDDLTTQIKEEEAKQKAFVIQNLSLPISNESSVKTNIQVHKNFIQGQESKEYYLFQEQLQLPLNEEQGVENMWNQFLREGVLKNYSLNKKCSNDSDFDKIDDRIQSAGLFKEFLQSVRGSLFEFKEFKINKNNTEDGILKEEDPGGKNPELKELENLGFSHVFTFEKLPEPHWAALGVILLGATQILAGVLIMAALSATGVGAIVGVMIARTLISEGCSDIIMGVTGLMTGNFTWKSYGEQKTESLIISGVFLGLGALGKSLSILNQARKARKYHSQAKQMMVAAKSAKNASEAKAILKIAKKARSKGNQSFLKARQAKTRYVHQATNIQGMKSFKDKLRHLTKYTAKKIGSSALSVMSNELVNQSMTLMMETMVKNILADFRAILHTNYGEMMNENTSLNLLLGRMYEILPDQERNQAVDKLFKKMSGLSKDDTQLFETKNTFLSVIENSSSVFSDLADMHMHSGGSKNKIDMLKMMSIVVSQVINGLKFFKSCDYIFKTTEIQIQQFVESKEIKKAKHTNQELSEQSDKENFVLRVSEQYHEFLIQETLMSFEKNIIRPILQQKVNQFVRNKIGQAKATVNEYRMQRRLDALSTSTKKMGHLEVSSLLNQRSNFIKELNGHEVTVLKQTESGLITENINYMKRIDATNKKNDVGILIKDGHATPCLQVDGVWKSIDLPESIKNACIPQTLCFAYYYAKNKSNNISHYQAAENAKQHASDPSKLQKFKDKIISSFRDDCAYRSGFLNRDFKRYRDIAKAGAKPKRKHLDIHENSTHTEDSIVAGNSNPSTYKRKAPNTSGVHLFAQKNAWNTLEAFRLRDNILHFSNTPQPKKNKLDIFNDLKKSPATGLIQATDKHFSRKKNNTAQCHIVSDQRLSKFLIESILPQITKKGALDIDGLNQFTEKLYYSPQEMTHPIPQKLRQAEINHLNQAKELLKKFENTKNTEDFNKFVQHIAATGSKNFNEGDASINSGIGEKFDAHHSDVKAKNMKNILIELNTYYKSDLRNLLNCFDSSIILDPLKNPFKNGPQNFYARSSSKPLKVELFLSKNNFFESPDIYFKRDSKNAPEVFEQRSKSKQDYNQQLQDGYIFFRRASFDSADMMSNQF